MADDDHDVAMAVSSDDEEDGAERALRESGGTNILRFSLHVCGSLFERNASTIDSKESKMSTKFFSLFQS